MLQQITIGKRLFAGFFILLAFVLIVAAAGQWALTSSVDTAEQVLNVDFATNSAANDVNIAVLDMRRFEKDLFLNIGDRQKETDYFSKWDAARRKLDEHLDKLEQTDHDESDRAVIRQIRGDIALQRTSDRSLMPDGMETVLNPQDLADLIAWLRAK